MDSLFPFPLLTFPDLQAGTGYVSRLPLANPAAAEEQIIQFLDSLLASPPDSADLFAMLEELRVPMAYVEEEMGKRYHDKPLVLADVEEKCFQQVIGTWRKLERAYALCFDAGEERVGEPDYATRMATVLHRRLHCVGMVILEHYRIRRELPPGLWLEFHGQYRTAEERGLALLPVEDGLDSDNGATHCTAAYATFLLVDMASPYSRGLRDTNLTRRWAALWATLVAVHGVEDGSQIPPYVLELDKDVGLHPAAKGQPIYAGMRCLDTTRLGRQVGDTLNQLRKKISPAQLGLGEEAASQAARLLDQLLRSWSQASMPRKFRRFSASGMAKVCTGFEAMHFFISGRPFEQPEVAKTYSRSEFNALFSARELAVPGQRPVIRAQEAYPADEWEVINHSANGFRLSRSPVGQKMSHGGLLALCPHDGERFLLAYVSWLMQEQAGGLVAGVSVLPGLPTGVAVRLSSEAKDNRQPFVRGFLLSPVPNVAERGSIVLPLGTYQASRIFDIYADGFWQIRLKHILQRGADFERVSFETV